MSGATAVINNHGAAALKRMLATRDQALDLAAAELQKQLTGNEGQYNNSVSSINSAYQQKLNTAQSDLDSALKTATEQKNSKNALATKTKESKIAAAEEEYAQTEATLDAQYGTESAGGDTGTEGATRRAAIATRDAQYYAARDTSWANTLSGSTTLGNSPWSVKAISDASAQAAFSTSRASAQAAHDAAMLDAVEDWQLSSRDSLTDLLFAEGQSRETFSVATANVYADWENGVGNLLAGKPEGTEWGMPSNFAGKGRRTGANNSEDRITASPTSYQTTGQHPDDPRAPMPPPGRGGNGQREGLPPRPEMNGDIPQGTQNTTAIPERNKDLEEQYGYAILESKRKPSHLSGPTGAYYQWRYSTYYLGIEWSREFGPVEFVPDQISGISDLGGSGSAKARAALQNFGSGAKIGVDGAGQAAAIGIFIGTLVIPGPEDVIFAAVAARYGLTSLKAVNGVLYQSGKKLEGEELAKAVELLKRTSDEYIENGGKLLDDEAWQLSQLRKLSDEAPVGGLASKTLPELKALTNKLPWDKLWEEGAEGITKALARLRAGEKVLPDGISREALEAYAEIARRALANPAKATEVQRLRLQFIEELLKGMGR